jgi:acyl-CoA thioesterase
MKNPFAQLIDLRVDERATGSCTLSLEVAEHHLNPHAVVHGAVLYALADTGMGAALYSTLEPGEICATIEIKINYFKPVSAGKIVCRSELVNRGKTVANLESRLYLGDALVGQANGNFAIFRPKSAQA